MDRNVLILDEVTISYIYTDFVSTISYDIITIIYIYRVNSHTKYSLVVLFYIFYNTLFTLRQYFLEHVTIKLT